MIHMNTDKNLNALITETPDAYLWLWVTRYAFVEILKVLLSLCYVTLLDKFLNFDTTM